MDPEKAGAANRRIAGGTPPYVVFDKTAEKFPISNFLVIFLVTFIAFQLETMYVMRIEIQKTVLHERS